MKHFFYNIPRVIGEGGGVPGTTGYTEKSISNAFAAGSGAVSLSVWITSDGHPVVAPDSNLEKFTGSKGSISTMTLAQLNQVFITAGDGETGYPILTLDYVLEKFPASQFLLNVMAQSVRMIGRVAEIIRGKNAASRILISSPSGDILAFFRRIIPDCATGFSLWEIITTYALFRSGFLVFKKTFKGDAFVAPENLGTSYVANANLVKLLKEKGIHVFVRTVDTEKSITRVFQSGADGVITSDVPAALAIEKKTAIHR